MSRPPKAETAYQIPLASIAYKQQRQPETKRRTAHQHQRGQRIAVDTNQDAGPEAGRNREREDARRDGDRPTILGPAGEADDSAPAVERHDANSDRNQHPGHAEQYAVGATNDVDSVLVAASSDEHRAGIDHRGTDAEISEGEKQRDRRDQGHQTEYGFTGFPHDDRCVREPQQSDDGRAEDAVERAVEQRATLLGRETTLVRRHRRMAETAARTMILAALRAA